MYKSPFEVNVCYKKGQEIMQKRNIREEITSPVTEKFGMFLLTPSAPELAQRTQLCTPMSQQPHTMAKLSPDSKIKKIHAHIECQKD